MGSLPLNENPYLIEKDGVYMYPLNNSDRPVYRKDSENNEIYENVGGKYIIAADKGGLQYYAKKANGDQYYPPDNSAALLANEQPFYAKLHTGEDVFPKDSNDNEFYLSYIIIGWYSTIPDRYAKLASGKEIYPQRKEDKLSGFILFDYILNETYAKNENNEYYYPKDEFNNEFYMKEKPAEEIVLENYAVTNDGKIILPKIRNLAYVDKNKQPNILEENIIGKLVRNSMISGYLTNVVSPNPPNIPQKRYPYRDKTDVLREIIPENIQPSNPPVIQPSNNPNTTKSNTPNTTKSTIPFYKTWYFYIIVIIVLIVKAFAIWWMFFRGNRGFFSVEHSLR